MSFTIQYASNLFVHKNNSWKQAKNLLKIRAAPNLALLGNIGIPNSQKTKDFVRWCSDNWNHVYCVPGPCELQSHDHLYGLFKNQPKNVSILDQRSLDLENGLMILGCPLWSGHATKINIYKEWSENERYFFAFKNSNHIQNWHEDDKEFLINQIRHSQIAYGPTKKLILLTHHVPHQHFLPSNVAEKERQIILHDGNIHNVFGPHVVGCLSGSGGGSITGFFGRYKAFCGVNAAFLGPSMVPNRQYRPDMVASFPTDTVPPAPEPTGNVRAFYLPNILPFPKLAIAHAHSVL